MPASLGMTEEVLRLIAVVPVDRARVGEITGIVMAELTNVSVEGTRAVQVTVDSLLFAGWTTPSGVPSVRWCAGG